MPQQMLTYINVSAEVVGVNPNFAEYLVSLVNGGSIVGRILSAYLGDHYGPLNLMAPSAFFAGVTTIIWPFLRTQPGFIILGLMNGCAVLISLSLNQTNSCTI